MITDEVFPMYAGVFRTTCLKLVAASASSQYVRGVPQEWAQQRHVFSPTYAGVFRAWTYRVGWACCLPRVYGVFLSISQDSSIYVFLIRMRGVPTEKNAIG